MIRVTLRDVLEGQEALQKTAFRIGRLLKKLEDVLTSYNEVRTSLLEKYAKHKEDGSFEVNDKNEYIFEDVNVFIEEMNKLIMEEVEVEADPIDFKSIEDVSFTPVEITLLEPFVKFEDEDK